MSSKPFRPLVAALLAGVLLVGVSCTSDQTPLEPTPTSSMEQPSPLLSGVPIVGNLLQGLLENLDLQTCSTQPYAKTTKAIGRMGGTIVVGTHRLVIPPGALRGPVTITAEQVPGNVNSVRFAPEGLRFATPAVLTMSYQNCTLLALGAKIVYTDEGLRILELLPSLDLRSLTSVTGRIRHFSRYAVAW